MVTTFLIAMREGLEAALIVGILVAYLKKSERSRSLPLVWLGVGLATGLSLLFGGFLSFTSHELTPRGEMVFAGTTSLVAVALVTFMVFWMKRTSRTIKGTLENKVDQALPLGGGALVAAAFFAVAREGLETALFLFSNFKTISNGIAPTIGLLLGLTAAIFLGVALYRKAIKINLSKFFLVTGSALLIVAGGVLSHGIAEFQNFGALPGAHAFAWKWRNPNNLIDTFLSGTIGISTTITWLQLFIWIGYLGITLPLFFTPKSSKALTPKQELKAVINAA